MEKILQVNNERLQNTLQCAICREVFLDPVTLMCQHTFCLECLNKATGSGKEQEPDLTVSEQDLEEVGLPIATRAPPPVLMRQQSMAVLCDSSECPLCKAPFILPANANSLIDTLCEILAPDRWQKRVDEQTAKRKANEDFSLEVERLKKNMLRTLLNNGTRYAQ